VRKLAAILCIGLSACIARGMEAGAAGLGGGSANEDAGGLAAIARSVKPGEWRLIPRPVSEILYKRGQINDTTWGISGPSSIVYAWNGGAYDPVRRELHLHGGGHADYGGNEVLTFSFETLRWRRSIEAFDLPSSTPQRPCPQPARDRDGPPSGHTYDGLVWSMALDAMLYFQTHGFCLQGDHARDPAFRTSVWLADTRKGQWRRLGPAGIEGAPATVELPDGGIVVFGYQGPPRLYEPGSGRYVRSGGRMNWEFPQGIYAPDRDLIYVSDWSRIFRLDPKLLHAVEITRHDRLGAGTSYTDGFAYHPPTRQLVFWSGDRRIVMVNPDTRATRVIEARGTAPRGSRPGSKFIHLPDLDVFVGVSSHDDGVWLYRLPPD
jgi:hypothetical protein